MEQTKTLCVAEKRRLVYLDNAKAFAMIMVVLGHCSLINTYPFLYQWVQSFHVPIFFVISGILLGIKKECSIEGAIKYDLVKKIKTYLIPFYVFSMLNTTVVGGIKYFADASQGAVFVKEWLLNTLMLNARTANWFLPCLFLSELIFIFELKHFCLKVLTMGNVILAVSTLLFSKNFAIVLVVLNSFAGVICLNVGYLLYIKRDWLKGCMKQWFFILLASVYIIIFILNGDTAMYGINAGNFPFLYYPEILLGAIVILVIFKKFVFRPLKLVTWLGQNTIVILTTHQTLLELFWVIDAHTGKLLNKIDGVLPFLLCLAMILIEIPIICFCNRYLYFIFGKKHKEIEKTKC